MPAGQNRLIFPYFSVIPPRMMARSGSIRRLLALPPRDWFLMAEALILLAAASAMVRLLPFRRIVRLAQSPLRAAGENSVDLDRLRRAIEAWARRVPWRAMCIQCALALHLLLRRRGIASELHYGIRKAAERPLSAHVWLSVDGVTLIGGEAAAEHVPVATFRSTRRTGS